MAARPIDTAPPLVVHVIHELGIGGLENGLVNLINRMPAQRYRHAILCMTRHGEFRQRIRRGDVDVYSLHRGQAPLARTYWQLYRLFRRLRPSIVHSRNRSGLDALLPALCAGVRVRIHGEHGRDVDDLDGSNARIRRLKRAFRPFVSHYTTVSRDLAHYLEQAIGVPAGRISQIYNGVDTELFHPEPSAVDAGACARPPRALVVGTVGRLQAVKNQVLLVKAFGAALRSAPGPMQAARLVVVGEGSTRAAIEQEIARQALGARVELLGARDDVAQQLRAMDVFVLPSLAEGISNTILEAMASGLPVVATRVGGNAELVAAGRTGVLVDVDDVGTMADAIAAYAADASLRARHGEAGRQRAESEFSLDAMVSRYAALYDRLLGREGVQPTERQLAF